jgi:hypothetical protein
MGMFMVTVRTRFAGLHRPDTSEVPFLFNTKSLIPPPTGRAQLACDGLEPQSIAKEKPKKKRRREPRAESFDSSSSVSILSDSCKK